MKPTTIVRVTVNARAASSNFGAWFLALPSVADIVEAIQAEPQDANDKQTIDDYKAMAELVQTAKTLNVDLREKSYHKIDVEVARVRIGYITIESVKAYAPSPPRSAQEAVEAILRKGTRATSSRDFDEELGKRSA